MSSTKWCTVAPLFYMGGGLEVPFDLGNDVRVEGVPHWVKSEDVAGHLSFSERDRLTRLVHYALSTEYEAHSLGEPDPSWKGTQPMSKQEHARHRIVSANLALWLAKPSSLGFGVLVHAEQGADGGWRWREIKQPPWLEPDPRDLRTSITGADQAAAAELLSAIVGLRPQGALWVALRTLWSALCEQMWELSYILFWVALEALFGPGDGREISYRISQRIAFFLTEDRESARGVFKETKEGYSWRSRAVHGMRLDTLRKAPQGEAADLMYDAQELTRKAIKKILGDAKLVEIFSGKKRERYLDDLVFSA